MARYVIGDVQGCFDSLSALVEQLPINPRKDTLWFVGDLVNRGPKSLKTLRQVMATGRRAVCVLGNHDLHLLAVAAGARSPQKSDTLQAILRAPDRDDIIDWLRTRPLAHMEGHTLMVHAGVLPHWSARRALALGQEVSARLKSRHWKDFLHEMVAGGKPHWADGLRGQQRMRAILSTFTRLRYLQRNGIPDFKHKNAPEHTPGLIPWFDAPHRKTSRHDIVFGHWSTLGLMVRPHLIALDAGCVWGRQLAAIRLEDRRVYLQSSLEGAAEGGD